MPSPDLHASVAEIFTKPIGDLPLRHPDISHTFQNFQHSAIKRYLLHHQFLNSEDQGDALYDLVSHLPSNNKDWNEAGVHLIPGIDCYQSAFSDVFRATTELPNNATQFLCQRLRNTWLRDSESSLVYNDTILGRGFGYAATAKDIRQGLSLAILAGRFMSADMLAATLSRSTYRDTFVYSHVWAALFELALEYRPNELLSNGPTLESFLQQDLTISNTLDRIRQTPATRAMHGLPVKWIYDYHTTS